jgi:tetratricopeptide (TPR) repeat protein/serine phosphatase RsbU (regulator of sigma subunit)
MAWNFYFKHIFLFLLMLGLQPCIFAQDLNPELERHIKELKTAENDTNKLNLLGTIIMEAPDGVWENYNEPLKILSNSLMKSNDKAVSRNATKAQASALNNEAFILDRDGDLEKALPIYKQSLNLSREIKDQLAVAKTLNNIADLYDKQGNIELAIELHKQSLEIRQLIKEQEGIAESFNNLGLLYDKLGNYTKALNYHQRSLKIREKIGDLNGVSGSLINIGNIYSNNLDEIEKSIEYYRKSIAIQQKQGDKKLEAYAINFIGVAHKKIAEKLLSRGDFNGLVALRMDSALLYFSSSLKITKTIDDKRGIANSINNIGEVYQSIGKLTEAESYFNEALAIRKQLNNKKDIAFSLTNLAALNYRLGKIDLAKQYADEALQIATELGFPENIKRITKLLNELYYVKGDYKKSLEMYKLYIQMRDSIQNQQTKKEMLKQQFKFEYDKKVEADSLFAVEEKKVVEARFEQEKTQRYALYGGLVIVLIFGGVMFNRFRITQKQKNIIEIKEHETQKQKLLVEKKNTEILSSIEYAKRIQATILPPLKEIKENIPESFVLYLPKDIVAGDFYWMKKVQFENLKMKEFENEKAVQQPNSNSNTAYSTNSLILIAACDSTGHGVPGAMVSVVCSKAMDKAVKEFELSQPSLILDKVADIVIEDFGKNNDENDEIKDGMDVSILSINHAKKEIMWSGANNSLIIIAPDGKLSEIKPDKQPIGKTDARQLFTNHTFQYEKGTCIYLYTDGFADQFGGPNGKKFQRAQLKELLTNSCKYPIQEQYHRLLDTFLAWKGDEEQVDDVCVIGIRI